jgi:plastocyanin domain-containing protein
LEEIEEQMANLPPAEEIPVGPDGVQDIKLVVSRSGYTPVHLSVKAGVPVRLTFRQLGYVPGGNELNVRWGPTEGTYIMLASISDTRVLEFTPKVPGEYRYSCPHEWYWGVMTVRE